MRPSARDCAGISSAGDWRKSSARFRDELLDKLEGQWVGDVGNEGDFSVGVVVESL